jgi:PAS domain-containing protein
MTGRFGRFSVQPVRWLADWRSRRRRGRSHKGRAQQKPYEQQGLKPSQGLNLRSLLSMRTLAGQVFVLQVGIVLLLAVASVLALVFQSRQDSRDEARNRSVAVAQTFARSPGLEAALKSPKPSAVLQPLAEKARKAAGVDFIVVMNKQGIRYSHPRPDRIGKKFVGTIEPSLKGHVTIETVHGPLGEEMQAVVPVRGANGSIVALASAGLKVKNVAVLGNRHLPIILGAGAAALAVATAGTALVTKRLRRQTHGLGPAEMTQMYEHHDAVLHTVREGVLIVGGEGQLLLANDEARRLLDLSPDVKGQPVTDIGLPTSLAKLLASGRPASDEVHMAGERLLAVNHESTAKSGGPPGSVATLRDTTELRTLTGKADAARQRLKLLYDAGAKVGTTLDVERTCEELAKFAVPRFADFVTVDLADEVLCGEEPASADMRRVAVNGIRDNVPLYAPGQLIHFVSSTPQRAAYNTGRAILQADMRIDTEWQKQDPSRARKLLASGLHSVIAIPVQARGTVLGVAAFWRAEKPDPFDEEDVSLAEELVARAAVSIDNARRYTREHSMAVALQRSLLPQTLPEQNAIEVAYRYLPAQPGLGGVGGDWFDVIPLSGSRVALVVGDVVRHGHHGQAAHRGAEPLHTGSAPRRAALAPGRAGHPYGPVRIVREQWRGGHGSQLPVCDLRPGEWAVHHGPGGPSRARDHPSGRQGRLPRPAGWTTPGAWRSALRNRRGRAARGQPAGSLHRRAGREPGAGHPRRHGPSEPHSGQSHGPHAGADL